MFQEHITSTVADSDSRYSLTRTTPPHKRLVVVTLIVLLAVLGAGASFYPVEDNLWLTVQPTASSLDCEDVSLIEWTTPMFVESGNLESLRALQPGQEVWIFAIPGDGPAFQTQGSIAQVAQLECAASQLVALEIESSRDEILQLKSIPTDQVINVRVRLGESSLVNLLFSTLRSALAG